MTSGEPGAEVEGGEGGMVMISWRGRLRGPTDKRKGFSVNKRAPWWVLTWLDGLVAAAMIFYGS